MFHAPFAAVDGFMLGCLLERPSARRENQESSARNRFATCSIRVSISVFVRFLRIVRSQHPLRSAFATSGLNSRICRSDLERWVTVPPSHPRRRAALSSNRCCTSSGIVRRAEFDPQTHINVLLGTDVCGSTPIAFWRGMLSVTMSLNGAVTCRAGAFVTRKYHAAGSLTLPRVGTQSFARMVTSFVKKSAATAPQCARRKV
jgi:hypothetical protein